MNETKTTTRRRKFSAVDRERWIDQYERSGQSLRDFCRDHLLCVSNLSRWVRSRRAATQRAHHQGSLVEVRVAPAMTDSATIVRVCLLGGVTMEVTRGTDAIWLGAVLRALQPVEG
jgi:transposase-like protein